MHRREEIGLYANGLSCAPRPARRSRMHDWSWDPRVVPMLLACVALAALVMSGAVVALMGGTARAAILTPVPTEESGAGFSEGPIIQDEPPPPPYEVIGFTYDAIGAKLPGCIVNITNTRTGDWNLTLSTDDEWAYYRFDLNNMTNGWEVGDIINVTAYKDMAWGWNETEAMGGAYIFMDVHLTAIIPEFPMVVLPVVGMLAVFAVVSFGRRRR